MHPPQAMQSSSNARMRETVKPVLLECREGFDNCFCASMGTNEAWDYAAAVRIDDICALMEICDEELLPYFWSRVKMGSIRSARTEKLRACRISPDMRADW